MSVVTASSPAMNCAHSRAAYSRSRSDNDSQSARSREKSMSAGFQNFAFPPAKSLSGRLFQLSPPAVSDPNEVRAMRLPSTWMNICDVTVSSLTVKVGQA